MWLLQTDDGNKILPFSHITRKYAMLLRNIYICRDHRLLSLYVFGTMSGVLTNAVSSKGQAAVVDYSM